ncbi:alpha/beta-hydrolase [Ramaria rubella]|nr:alpha/beta-hydrolase [Ramaria rubella]
MLLFLFLILPFVSSSPVPAIAGLCDIPFIGNLLCQRATISPIVHVGTPRGQPTTNGVTRYSVKYASAKRWSSPVMSTTWTPSNPSDPTALPLACPQSILDPSQFSEDCLDLVLYVPSSAKNTYGGIPTIVWVHGGSFIVGSATDPGLDGSNLAVASDAIVAVVQYRLGTLGLLPPSSTASNGNLALQDLMTALTFLHGVLPSFGGSSGTPQLMLAGQSSGASLIRALLGTPAASPLFSNAWLHSDTLDYGFLTSGALSTLRNAWVSELNCTFESVGSCEQNMDVATLLSHQSTLLGNAPSLGPEYFPSAPLRPSPLNIFISDTFTQSNHFPSESGLKPLVVTTVKDEATFTIYSMFPDTQGVMPVAEFLPVVTSIIGPTRALQVVNSTFYSLTSDNVDNNTSAVVDPRTVLTTFGTDLVWRCPGWKLARDWATHGAQKQFTGLFTQGVSYPGNSAVPECTVPGTVCHQDDIEVVFGTASPPSPLTKEIQARYAAFVRTGNPNAAGYSQWNPASTNDAETLNLGGPGSIAVGACVPTFWGEQVEFDYQVLGE